jgi:drug/metabolite transporter (DMT)-like permease
VSGPVIGFGILVALVGTNLVAIRVTNRELPPLWNAGARFALAAIVFGAIAVARRSERPSRRSLVDSAAYGSLAFALFFGFLYAGLVEVSAGLGQTVLALGPLITLFLAVAVGLERLRPLAVAGGVIALAGIGLSFGVRDGEDVPLVSLLAVVAAATAFAAGGIVVKASRPTDPYVRNAIATSLGAAMLLGMSVAIGERWALPSTSDAWLAFIYLVLPGTVAVFSVFLYLLRNWTASRVSYQFVLAPIVAIGLGALLLDEPLTPGVLIGAALVIAGVYVGALYKAEPDRSKVGST